MTLSVTLFGGATLITTVSSTETQLALSRFSLTPVVSFVTLDVFVTLEEDLVTLDDFVRFSPSLEPPVITLAEYVTGDNLKVRVEMQ